MDSWISCSAAEMLFGFGAMTGHIVIIGGAGALHLLDSLFRVIVGFLEVGPIMDFLSHGYASRKRETEGHDHN